MPVNSPASTLRTCTRKTSSISCRESATPRLLRYATIITRREGKTRCSWSCHRSTRLPSNTKLSKLPLLRAGPPAPRNSQTVKSSKSWSRLRSRRMVCTVATVTRLFFRHAWAAHNLYRRSKSFSRRLHLICFQLKNSN